MSVITPRGRASSAPPNLLPHEQPHCANAEGNAIDKAVASGQVAQPRIVGNSSNNSIDGIGTYLQGGGPADFNFNNNTYNNPNSSVNRTFHQYNSSSSSSNSSSNSNIISSYANTNTNNTNGMNMNMNISNSNSMKSGQNDNTPLHGILRHDPGSNKNTRFKNLMIRVNSSSGKDSLETDYLRPLPPLKGAGDSEHEPPFMDSLLSFLGLGYTKKNNYMKIEE